MEEREEVHNVMGLMSGTSIDGIDAATIKTDGKSYIESLAQAYFPYPDEIRDKIRAVMGTGEYTTGIQRLERNITRLHAQAVRELIAKSGIRPDLIGFHGQTLYHDPLGGRSFQIGDGALLAQEVGIDVVNDFRSADLRAGGQGAPLLPLYHKTLVEQAGLQGPVLILNLGGVANMTWINSSRPTHEGHNILAFDTGPAGALIDDLVNQETGQPFDKNGELAAKGVVDQARLKSWLAHPYFQKPPPKSLDRDEWEICNVSDMNIEDGAATLSAFTVQSIICAIDHLPPEEIGHVYVCGGGRHNGHIMSELQCALQNTSHHHIKAEAIEALGWDGDFIEAQGFAYLAKRSCLNLPLSHPGTTGCQKSVTGGVLHRLG